MNYDLKEKDIQKQVIEYLQIKGIFSWRNNVGAGKLQGGRFVRFGVPGAPDVFAIKGGILWGLEIKRPGKKQSPLQKEFGEGMVRSGAKYLVVFSLDDVIAIL